ncbi:MAG: hypothetical protein ACJAZS_000448 [Alteromonas naphthalenivorans]|jgi:hypothetical protein
MQQQEPKLNDIYGVEYNPWFLQSWFIYSVIICVLLVIAYGVYRWYTKRVKTELSYGQQALDALDILKDSDWSDNKQFYIQLTALVKQFLQQRFNKKFIGTTDTECLELLKTDRFIPEWVSARFEDVIDGVMFVKFANAQAAQDRMKKDLESILTIVQNTIQK